MLLNTTWKALCVLSFTLVSVQEVYSQKDYHHQYQRDYSEHFLQNSTPIQSSFNEVKRIQLATPNVDNRDQLKEASHSDDKSINVSATDQSTTAYERARKSRLDLQLWELFAIAHRAKPPTTNSIDLQKIPLGIGNSEPPSSHLQTTDVFAKGSPRSEASNVTSPKASPSETRVNTETPLTLSTLSSDLESQQTTLDSRPNTSEVSEPQIPLGMLGSFTTTDEELVESFTADTTAINQIGQSNDLTNSTSGSTQDPNTDSSDNSIDNVSQVETDLPVLPIEATTLISTNAESLDASPSFETAGPSTEFIFDLEVEITTTKNENGIVVLLSNMPESATSITTNDPEINSQSESTQSVDPFNNQSPSSSSATTLFPEVTTGSLSIGITSNLFENEGTTSSTHDVSQSATAANGENLSIIIQTDEPPISTDAFPIQNTFNATELSNSFESSQDPTTQAPAIPSIIAAEIIPQTSETSLFPPTAAPDTPAIASENSQSESMTEGSTDSVSLINVQSESPVDFSLTALSENQDTANLNQESATTSGESFSGTTSNMAESGFSTEPEQFITQTSPVNQTMTYITETTEPTAFEQIIQATLPASIVPPIESANIELGLTPIVSVSTESSPSSTNSESPFQIHEITDLVTEITTNSEVETGVSSQSSLNNVDIENALDMGVTVQNPLPTTENPITTLVYQNDTLQLETTSISAPATVDESNIETTTMYTDNIEASTNGQSLTQSTEHPNLTSLDQQIDSGIPETSSISESTVPGEPEQETTPMYAENTESNLSSNVNDTHVEDDVQSVTTAQSLTQSTEHPTWTTLNQGIDTELPGTLSVSASTTIFGAPEQETTPSYTGNTESNLPPTFNETVQEEILPTHTNTDSKPLPQSTENPSLTTLNHQSDTLLTETSPIPESTTLLSIPEQETTQGLTLETDLDQLSNINETSLEDNLQTDISAQNLLQSTEYPTLTTLYQQIDIILPETSSMSASTTIFGGSVQETTASYTSEAEPDLPSYVNQTDQEAFPPTTTIQMSLVPQSNEYPNLITSTVKNDITIPETSSVSLPTTAVNDLEQETIHPDTSNTESNLPMNLNETEQQHISEISTIQSLSQYTENPISTTISDEYDTVVPETSSVSASTTTAGMLEPDMNLNAVAVTTEFHVSSATFDSFVPTAENLDLTTSNYHIDALLPETSSSFTLTTVSGVPELDTTTGHAVPTESNLPSQLIDNDVEIDLPIGTTGNSLLQPTENTDVTTSGYHGDTFSQETSSAPVLTTIMATGLLDTTETQTGPETEVELTDTATETLTSSTSMQNPITSATEPYDNGSGDSSSTPGEMPAMNKPGTQEIGITAGLEESSTPISTSNQTEIYTVELTEPANSLQSTTILPDDISPLTESPFTENETTPSYVVITETHASPTPNENDVEIATVNPSYATVPDNQNQYSTTENSPNEDFGQNETDFTLFSNQTETFTMEPEPTISPEKTTVLPDDISPLTDSPFTENETTPSYVVITESHTSPTPNENDVEIATANSSYATVPDSQNQYSTTENFPNEDFGQNETDFTLFSNQTETFTMEPEPTISPEKTTVLPDDISPLTDSPFTENETTPSYVVITESHTSPTPNENDVEIATANSSYATVPDSQNQYSTTENSPNEDFGQNETDFTLFSNQTETFTMEPEPTISPEKTTVLPEDISQLTESPVPENDTTFIYVVTTESHASPTAAENDVEIVPANPSHATATDSQIQHSTTEYFPDETNGQNETDLTSLLNNFTSNAESSTESDIPEFSTVGLPTTSNSTLDVDDLFQETTEEYDSMTESSTDSIELIESMDIDSLVTDPPEWNLQGPVAEPDGISTLNSTLFGSGLSPELQESLGIGQNVLLAGIITSGLLQIAAPSSPTVDNGIPALLGVGPDFSSSPVASNNVYQPETVTYSPPAPAPVQNVGFFGQLRLALRQLFVQYGIFGFFFLAPLVFLSQIFSTATGRSFAYNKDHLANLLLDLSDGMLDEPVFLLKSLAQAFPEQFEPPQSPDTAYLNDFLFNLFPEQTHHIVFARGLKLPVLLSLAFPDKMGNLSDEDWQTVNTLQTVPDNPPMNLGHILADMASDVVSYAVKQERQLRSFIVMLESEIFD